MLGKRDKYFITAKNFDNVHVITGWFTKEDLLEKLQQWEAQGYTIWASINDLEEGDKTIDGVQRFCDLWFDIDSKRADKSQPAKPEEILEALERANKLRTFLKDQFHAKCFLALSGNGVHIHCPFECVEIPREKRRQLNANLQAFAKAVSTIAEAEIDHYDTRRVTAIIGLKNQKITAHPLETGWEKELYDPEKGNDMKHTLEEIENARKQNTFLRDIILNYDTLAKTLGLETNTPAETQPVAMQPDADFTPETLEKLNELRKKDTKLDRLLKKQVCIEKEPETINEPCEYKYQSRSEAEEALLVLLVCYCFTKSQIYYIMENISQIGKWKEKEESYRELSYRKALDYCEKHKAEMRPEQKPTQTENFNEITHADFQFENGNLFEILETPLLTIKIGKKKITFIHEGKTIETKLTADPDLLQKDFEKTNATPEEIAYFTRVINEGIERNFIITKVKGDTLPKFASRIADVLLENFNFATIAETKDILMYANGVYKAGAETFIETQIESIIPPETITKNLIEEVLGHIQRSTYKKLEQFNADPYKLNLKNGIFDLKTFEFTQHTPSFLSTMQIPVEYNPKAKSELWEKVVNEDLYSEDVPLLQEAFGYVLFPDNRAQKMFVFLGEGSNGKSLILHVLEALVGKEHVSNLSPQAILTNEFALSELRDKLVNIYADLPSLVLQSTGKLKALVSGDSLTADEKYKKPFQLRNRAKFFFSANQLPKVTDNTRAFYRRLVIINFPKTFDENTADPHLFEKLTYPEELSGILNWALEGLKRLIQKGFKFSYTKNVEEIAELYTKASDPIKTFLEEETVEDPEAWIVKQELYRAYVEYVNTHKLQSPVTQNTFFKSLPKYTKVKTEHKNVKGERIWGFTGIRLKNENEKNDSNENETLRFNE